MSAAFFRTGVRFGVGNETRRTEKACGRLAADSLSPWAAG
jgi:hypothetical protein